MSRVLADRVEVFQSKDPSKIRFIYEQLLQEGIVATIENACSVVVDLSNSNRARQVIYEFTRLPTFWERIFGRRGYSMVSSGGEASGDGIVWIPESDRCSNHHHDCDHSGCDGGDSGDCGGDCGGGDGGGGGD